MTAATKPRRAQEGPSNWRQIVAQYQNPDVRRAVAQILTSVVALLAMMVAMYFSLRVSYWLTLLLAIPAAGFMLRTFIVFHDCGHGSFFANRKANDIVGAITGVLTFTPYYRWRHAHAVHHATAGDLDRREMGDIWTLTVDEYLDAPRWKQIAYRIYRNPLIIFTIGAWLSFLVLQRFPNFKDGKRERNSILWTDLALLLIFVAAGFTIGLGDFLLVLLPVMILGTSVGVWLFYVQHQFEGVYWERHKQWSYVDAALQGQLVLQAAQGPAVVLGQHRLPSHPPPEPAHPQLQPGAGLQRERSVPHPARHPALRHALAEVPPLRRGEPSPGGLRLRQGGAPAARSQGRDSSPAV